MPDVHTLSLFCLATAALVAIPGPTVVFIVARSLERGRAAGVVSMLGVEAGAMLHVLAAAAGLSALLASSPAALGALKIGGAVYLLALGARALRRRGGREVPASRHTGPARALFLQGLIVDLLNPKTALFFLAFVPQFVDPARGSVAVQTLVLGTCFVAVAALADGVYALVAGSFADRLRRSAAAHRRLDRVSGAAYLGLGLLVGVAPA